MRTCYSLNPELMGPQNPLAVMSRFGSSSFPAEVGYRVATDLARELAQVVSQPIFDFSRFVEAAGHQGFDPLLGGGSADRSHARIPAGGELDVRRQAGVDEPLGVGDRPFVEPSDPRRERLYERVQIGVGQGSIHVAIGLSLLSPDVFRAQEYFEGAVSTDAFGQSGHRAPAGDQPHAYLPLREDGLFAAGETHVAGERPLAPVAPPPPPAAGPAGGFAPGHPPSTSRPTPQT